MAQFVLVNVVVAVLMKHLEESHKQMEDDMDIDTELEREIEREQLFEEEQALCKELEKEQTKVLKLPLKKVSSLPSNFVYSTPVIEKKFNTTRRQTVQYFNPLLGSNVAPISIMSYNQVPTSTICESNENELNEEDGGLRKPIKYENRKNLLNKFRTQSFDVKLLETSESVDSNTKIGQSNDETSSINNNNMISKKTMSSESKKKFDYRQSSLDFDNRSNVCKHLFDNSNVCSNKTSFLAVPKVQTSRNRSDNSKQLLKQVALDEDEHTNENTLLLSGGNSGSISVVSASTVSASQIHLPSNVTILKPKTKNDSPISTVQEVHTLKVDESKDENFKKSESCELLRVISERRKM